MNKVNYQVDTNRLKKLQAFFCDVDGTLINSKREIGSFTKSTVMQLKDKIPFLLTSGRTYKGLIPYHEELKLDTPYLTLNGSCIIENGKVIDSVTMNSKILSDVLFYLGANYNEDSVNVFFETKWYTNRFDNPFVQEEYKILKFLPDRILDFSETQEDVKANKILYIGPTSHCHQIVAWAKEKYQEQLNIILTDSNRIEFFPKNIGKDITVKKYCRIKGYDIESVLCAGDSGLDISMLEACGFAAAPENAKEEVRAKANILLPSNENDAIGFLADDLLHLLNQNK